MLFRSTVLIQWNQLEFSKKFIFNWPKIITRVEDGNSLKDAVEKSILEDRKNDDHYGIICISNTGDIVVDKTKDMIFYASHNGSVVTSF